MSEGGTAKFESPLRRGMRPTNTDTVLHNQKETEAKKYSSFHWHPRETYKNSLSMEEGLFC